MHKYWKAYGGNMSYYLIVSESQVVEVNIETGIILFSKYKASIIAHSKGESEKFDYVKVSEEDFDQYFDKAILKLIEIK